jgi:lysophospholipase L1-like esterase
MDDPDRQDRNGFTYFRPCIESIEPEMVIIWLGTNNSKVRLLQRPETMIEQFDILIKWAKEKYPSMKIVVVPPPQIKTEYLNERMMDFFGDKAEGLIAMYQPVLAKYCADNSILYVHNAEKITADSIDGIHLSRESNEKVAEYIYEVISKK